ncbi:MAG: 50S ribosomal protein L29 [Candidatus Pacebacteria bacterium]|nr:50S ribosomal protein L29 [Candidatus Paceibacterota bacterium]
MKTKDLKNKNEADLKKLLNESQKKLQEMKFNLSLGKLKNTKAIHQLKKDIARILTIMKSNEKRA